MLVHQQRIRWRRPTTTTTTGVVIALLMGVASCSAAAEVQQRVAQASPSGTTTAPVADASERPAPTQMWIDMAANADGADGNAVIVRTGTTVAVYDAITLAERWRSDAAVLSADRRTAVASTPAPAGRGTTLTVVDIRRGTVRRTIDLAQARDVVAISTTGTRAAVVDPLDVDPATGMPLGRRSSSVDVIDLESGATVKTLTLDGNVVPEAFDAHGGMAIIEYVPAGKPERYRVRALEIATGRVSNVLTRDKTEIVDEMQGYGRAAVAKTDGSALFTLYRDGGRWGSAFVHQLLGQGQFAFCIDLPEVGFDDATAIALSPDERELFVAGAKGAVAVITARPDFGPEPPAVERMLWVPGIVGTPTAMAATATSIWLLVDGQLVTADLATGEVTGTGPAAAARGVGASADGRLIAVSTAERVVQRV